MALQTMQLLGMITVRVECMQVWKMYCSANDSQFGMVRTPSNIQRACVRWEGVSTTPSPWCHLLRVLYGVALWMWRPISVVDLHYSTVRTVQFVCPNQTQRYLLHQLYPHVRT
jgi:hypothetical protein